MQKEGEKPRNLIEALQDECNRVRQIISVYQDIPAGLLVVALIELDIKLAEKSISEMDAVTMIRMLTKLKEWELE
ncbi:hypothetical protein QNI19_16550 [Cytophagaceae bacterium DM2B3-1]|uniref:Uncharacterized protein n=1 Tax=Xanthocytophaga flava TaxID=3048013 RepID=A0ABT7CNI6_9BACT|nr:hypothetical protein [Xanthocytophaga flavus]MDJ1494557.1 hypothetical protein [Xanthocytophaga flavus]